MKLMSRKAIATVVATAALSTATVAAPAMAEENTPSSIDLGSSKILDALQGDNTKKTESTDKGTADKDKAEKADKGENTATTEKSTVDKINQITKLLTAIVGLVGALASIWSLIQKYVK